MFEKSTVKTTDDIRATLYVFDVKKHFYSNLKMFKIHNFSSISCSLDYLT